MIFGHYSAFTTRATNLLRILTRLLNNVAKKSLVDSCTQTFVFKASLVSSLARFHQLFHQHVSSLRTLVEKSLRLSHLIFPFMQPRRVSISHPVATITLWMVAVLTQLCSTYACVVADAAQVSWGWNDTTATNQPTTNLHQSTSMRWYYHQPLTFQVPFDIFKDLNACIIRKLPFKIFDHKSFRELANTALRKCVCSIPSVT